MIWTGTILGPPRTKKNSGRKGRNREGRTMDLPSKAWEEWRDTCRFNPPLDNKHAALWAFYRSQIKGQPKGKRPPAPPGMLPEVKVNCAAIFYLDADRGDPVGYYQGLADLLQHHGIVRDDKWIRTWAGTPDLMVDAENPRVEVTLSPLAAVAAAESQAPVAIPPGAKASAFGGDPGWDRWRAAGCPCTWSEWAKVHR